METDSAPAPFQLNLLFSPLYFVLKEAPPYTQTCIYIYLYIYIYIFRHIKPPVAFETEPLLVLVPEKKRRKSTKDGA